MDKLKVVVGREKNIPKHIFNEVLKLRYQTYLEEGFIKSNKEKKDYDENDKHAVHFIALDGEKVVGTLRLISGKLPLGSIYSKEIKELKELKKCKNAVELSRFSVDEKYRLGTGGYETMKMLVSLNLVKKAVEYMTINNIDLLLIVVHPKYEERYKKFYGLLRYGEEKSYSKVEGNPAVLMYVDYPGLAKFLDKFSENVPKLQLKS
ncbi:GNAT family N-acetyltransferase [Candidatus Pacearchaeota archaeon]|nr:GNAT family N-acetyltransferase [Candidatus Pacearchaeota archaeon]